MSSFTDSLQTGDALDATSTRTGEQTGASLMNQWLWAASWLFFCIFLMSCQTSTCDIKLTWPRPPPPGQSHPAGYLLLPHRSAAPIKQSLISLLCLFKWHRSLLSYISSPSCHRSEYYKHHLSSTSFTTKLTETSRSTWSSLLQSQKHCTNSQSKFLWAANFKHGNSQISETCLQVLCLWAVTSPSFENKSTHTLKP